METKKSSSQAPIKIARWLAFAIAILLVVLGLLFVLDKILAYRVAEHYVDKLAIAFDMNAHLANIATWVGFAAIIFGTWQLFSFSRIRRRVGITVLFSLTILSSALLWYATRNHWFDTAGNPTKCYVVLRDRVHFGERPGTIDPLSGKTCQAVTPAIVPRLEAYNQGKRPRLLDKEPSDYFDRVSGEPIIWFGRNAGKIEFFDLVGYHPATGEELNPVSRDAIREYRELVEKQKEQAEKEEADKKKAAELQRAPKRLDSDQITFFDMRTGEAQVFYWRGPKGDWEFFDKAGFHPVTGEPLKLIDRPALTEWQKSPAAQKKAPQAPQQKSEVQQKDRPRDVVAVQPVVPPAVAIGPQCRTASLNTCREDFRFNQSRALTSCQLLTQCEPQNVIAWSYLGRLQMTSGNLEAAKHSFERQMVLGRNANDDGTVALAAVGLSRVALRHGEVDHAEAILRSNVRPANLRPVVRVQVELAEGAVAMRRRDFGAAKRSFEMATQTAISIDDRLALAEALYALGGIAIQQGDKQAACAHLRRSRELNVQLQASRNILEVDRQIGRYGCA